jgi:hypothetical protein
MLSGRKTLGRENDARYCVANKISGYRVNRPEHPNLFKGLFYLKNLFLLKKSQVSMKSADWAP